jgi:hypothetical protein
MRGATVGAAVHAAVGPCRSLGPGCKSSNRHQSACLSLPVPGKRPQQASPAYNHCVLIATCPIIPPHAQGLRNLDATPRLNLASFVTTYMEPECCDLMQDVSAARSLPPASLVAALA